MNTQIAEMLDRFDFQKVHRVMQALNWNWDFTKNGVPSVEELQKRAKTLLEIVASYDNCEMYVTTGGFIAEKRKEDNEYTVKLSFVIESTCGEIPQLEKA